MPVCGVTVSTATGGVVVEVKNSVMSGALGAPPNPVRLTQADAQQFGHDPQRAYDTDSLEFSSQAIGVCPGKMVSNGAVQK